MIRLSLFLVVLLLVSAGQSSAQLSYSGVRSLVLEHDSRLDDLDDSIESAVSTNDAAYTNTAALAASAVQPTSSAYTNTAALAASAVQQGTVFTGAVVFSDTVWDDLTLSSLQFRDPPGGEAAPALQVYVPAPGVTNFVLDFDTDERGFGILQMKHGYKRDSEVRPHIHWTSATACTSTWELAMSFGRIGGGMTNTYLQTAVFTNGTPYVHRMSSFPVITDMTNKLGESGVFLISLKCVAEGATTTNGPYLMDFDIHYQIDKVGSYNENPYE